ncbi:MAG: hypothetical protein ABIH21_05230 [Patescibacteria group bacterium]
MKKRLSCSLTLFTTMVISTVASADLGWLRDVNSIARQPKQDDTSAGMICGILLILLMLGFLIDFSFKAYDAIGRAIKNKNTA